MSKCENILVGSLEAHWWIMDLLLDLAHRFDLILNFALLLNNLQGRAVNCIARVLEVFLHDVELFDESLDLLAVGRIRHLRLDLGFDAIKPLQRLLLPLPKYIEIVLTLPFAGKETRIVQSSLLTFAIVCALGKEQRLKLFVCTAGLLKKPMDNVPGRNLIVVTFPSIMKDALMNLWPSIKDNRLSSAELSKSHRS